MGQGHHGEMQVLSSRDWAGRVLVQDSQSYKGPRSKWPPVAPVASSTQGSATRTRTVVCQLASLQWQNPLYSTKVVYSSNSSSSKQYVAGIGCCQVEEWLQHSRDELHSLLRPASRKALIRSKRFEYDSTASSQHAAPLRETGTFTFVTSSTVRRRRR